MPNVTWTTPARSYTYPLRFPCQPRNQSAWQHDQQAIAEDSMAESTSWNSAAWTPSDGVVSTCHGQQELQSPVSVTSAHSIHSSSTITPGSNMDIHTTAPVPADLNLRPRDSLWIPISPEAPISGLTSMSSDAWSWRNNLQTPPSSAHQQLSHYPSRHVLASPSRKISGPSVGSQQAGSKRRFGSDAQSARNPVAKRQKSTTPSQSTQPAITEDDRWILKLKQEGKLTWKQISTKFLKERGRIYEVPALQMQWKRLRDRLRAWSEGDIQALRLAHQFWLEHKFEIIATKVRVSLFDLREHERLIQVSQLVDFGSSEKWSAKQCQQKWAELYG